MNIALVALGTLAIALYACGAGKKPDAASTAAHPSAALATPLRDRRRVFERGGGQQPRNSVAAITSASAATTLSSGMASALMSGLAKTREV
jgi:hypothetical protein